MNVVTQFDVPQAVSFRRAPVAAYLLRRPSGTVRVALMSATASGLGIGVCDGLLK